MVINAVFILVYTISVYFTFIIWAVFTESIALISIESFVIAKRASSVSMTFFAIMINYSTFFCTVISISFSFFAIRYIIQASTIIITFMEGTSQTLFFTFFSKMIKIITFKTFFCSMTFRAMPSFSYFLAIIFTIITIIYTILAITILISTSTLHITGRCWTSITNKCAVISIIPFIYTIFTCTISKASFTKFANIFARNLTFIFIKFQFFTITWF